MKTPPTKAGYPVVNLCHDGKQVTVYIHVLVLNTFIGECPLGMECRHLDGNPMNNQLDNLQWGTSKENGEDRVEHGTSNKGKRIPTWDNRVSPRANLTLKVLEELKRQHGSWVKVSKIVDMSPNALAVLYRYRKGGVPSRY
jgi:hypothetical protein